MKKKALIFGITGQDGSYLSEFLLKKNCRRNLNKFSVKKNTKLFNQLIQSLV